MTAPTLQDLLEGRDVAYLRRLAVQLDSTFEEALHHVVLWARAGPAAQNLTPEERVLYFKFGVVWAEQFASDQEIIEARRQKTGTEGVSLD